jgi:hypothetical protein
MWASISSAAEYLDCSHGYIEQRAVMGSEDPTPGNFRYKWFGRKKERRYFISDLDEGLEQPVVGFVPRFFQAKV